MFPHSVISTVGKIKLLLIFLKKLLLANKIMAEYSSSDTLRKKSSLVAESQ